MLSLLHLSITFTLILYLGNYRCSFLLSDLNFQYRVYDDVVKRIYEKLMREISFQRIGTVCLQ